MRRTERAAYRTKFYSNLSSPTRFDEEPKINTTNAIGNEYQIAAADKVTKTTTICSVPYATEDNASDESIAKAAKRDKF